MFKALTKKKPQQAVAVDVPVSVSAEERKAVKVHWDQFLSMFIIRDVERDTNLNPCMSIVDLLDTIRVEKYRIVDPKKTRESMNQVFTPKEQTFFHLNCINGIDFTRTVNPS